MRHTPAWAGRQAGKQIMMKTLLSAATASDLSLIDNDAFNFVTGYVKTDITGDDVTDASDYAMADNNAFNFVSAITP